MTWLQRTPALLDPWAPGDWTETRVTMGCLAQKDGQEGMDKRLRWLVDTETRIVPSALLDPLAMLGPGVPLASLVPKESRGSLGHHSTLAILDPLENLGMLDCLVSYLFVYCFA